MASQPEIELKLVLPEQFLAQIADTPLLCEASASAKTEQLTSVYFDTPKFKLRKTGLSLRIRSDGKRHVQTVKSDHAGATSVTSRDEWEAEIAGTNPNFRALRGSSLEPLLSNNLRRALKPIFETQIERTLYPLRAGDASVEIALDRGQIKTGEKSTEICEIEIELKGGDRAEPFRLARTFAKVAPVRLSIRSKSERGYELVEGKPAEAVTADEVRLGAGSSTADAFQTIAESCLYQVIANWEAVHHSDPEGFHQMRVGLRRLRAAVSIFSEMLGDDESARVKRDLTWLTNELAPARQLTVFAASVLNPLRSSYPHELAVDLLVDEVERRRGDAERRVKTAIGSDRFRDLLLDTAQWIQAGDWRTTNDELVRASRERRVEDFAAEVLSRRGTNIGKRGKKLRELDARERHKLRIAAKKLRYGCEFFANLFSAAKAQKRRRAFLYGLTALQDCLGDLNDVSAHRTLCSSIADEHPSRHVAFLAGIASGREEAKIEPLLRSGLRAHRRLSKIEPFWR